jgi:hypothetical protein
MAGNRPFSQLGEHVAEPALSWAEPARKHGTAAISAVIARSERSPPSSRSRPPPCMKRRQERTRRVRRGSYGKCSETTRDLQDRQKDLLAPTRPPRCAFHRMAGLSGLARPAPLDAVTGFFSLDLRSLLLMRCVRMILGLKVLGLVRRTFAISCHEFPKVRKPSPNHEPTSIVLVDLFC